MKNSLLLTGFLLVSALLITSMVLAQDLEIIRQQRLKYGLSLYIADVTTTPEAIIPGGESTITLRLENVAPHRVRDAIIELELPSEFAPKDTAKKKIRTIEGLETIPLNFELITLPGVKEGVYKIPLRMSYIDEVGNSYSENNTISIRVSSEPKLFIEVADSEIYTENLAGEVTLRIANIGLGDLKFMIAELLDSEEYSILSSSQVYIGELDSDDTETAGFTIKAPAKREITLLLRLAYTDANDREHETTSQVNLLINGQNELAKKADNSFLVWGGLMLIAIIYFLIRRRARKAKEHHRAHHGK